MATRRGLVLILVAGVLGILAVLAAAFVTMAQLERKASLQRLYATKAQLLARSGLEDAVARLSAGQDAALASTRYGGEDYDGSGTFSMEERTYEVYGPTVLDVETCPVKQAMRPSFFRKDTFGVLPDLVWVEGRQRGYTGQLKGDAVSGGNVYVLKVEDESGKINVNGGFLDAQDRDDGGSVPDHRDPDVRMTPADPKDTGRGWNAQLVRILNILGSQPEVSVAKLGLLTLQNRPVGGYRSVKALEQAVGATKDLSPYLTVSAWSDMKVVHPNGYTGQPQAWALCEVKKGRQPLRLEEGGRPPVNLNAAPRPVLASLLVNLSGATWYHPAYANVITLSPALASSLADAMLVYRSGQPAGSPYLATFAAAGLTTGPFDTWGEFGAFCDSLVPTVVSGMVPTNNNQGGGNLCGADLIKANLDPNTMSNKELPDQLRWRWIDKSDLTVWSTEGSLGPTGTFKISTVGRVLDGRGKVAAEAAAGAMVQAFSLFRHTTQQDFVGPRKYLKDYLSLADASMDPTEGATASGAWWGGAAPGFGVAAMTYPCTPPALQAGNAADVDGCIGLATVQLQHVDPRDGNLVFLHHFDDAWDADIGNPPALKNSGINDVNLQPDLAKGVWPVSAATEPSTLYPDGIHIQEGRSPAFQAFGNLPTTITSDISSTTDMNIENRAAISYWVKPICHIGMQQGSWDWTFSGWNPAPGGFFADYQEVLDFSCIRTSSPDTQALMLGRIQSFWGLVGESAARDGPNDPLTASFCECLAVGADNDVLPLAHHRLPGARWYLVWANLDTFEELNDPAAVVSLGFRSARTSSLTCPYALASYADGVDKDANQNLVPDATVSMVLGSQSTIGYTDPYLVRPTYGNQVLDEFAICDFGEPIPPEMFHSGSTDQAFNTAWMDDVRWPAGRYCKQEALFLSPVIEPFPAGQVRILRADWTAYLPRENRKELWFEIQKPTSTYGTSSSPPWGPPPDTGRDRFIDPLLDDAPVPAMRIEMELLEEADTLASPAIRSLSRGGAVETLRQRFRYRARFKTTLQNPLSDPLLETPFLDDVTFFWQSMTGPRVLSWDAP